MLAKVQHHGMVVRRYVASHQQSTQALQQLLKLAQGGVVGKASARKKKAVMRG
jgi:hypothetical protein